MNRWPQLTLARRGVAGMAPRAVTS